jgi:hypothetical protein
MLFGRASARLYMCRDEGLEIHRFSSTWRVDPETGAKTRIVELLAVSISACGKRFATFRHLANGDRAGWAASQANGVQMFIENNDDGMLVLLFEIYDILDLTKPIAAVHIFTRGSPYTPTIQWSDDGELAVASYYGRDRYNSDGLHSPSMIALSAVSGKYWQFSHARLCRLESEYGGPGLFLGHAIRSNAAAAATATAAAASAVAAAVEKCSFGYKCLQDDAFVTADRFAIDGSHHLIMISAYTGRGPMQIEVQFSNSVATLTSNARYLLTRFIREDGYGIQLQLHDLHTDEVCLFQQRQAHVLEAIDVCTAVADNGNWVAMIACEPGVADDMNTCLHLYPRAERPGAMASRLAWMAAATSLRALRATQRHPLRDCLLRPDTLGAILAMAGPLAGAAPCARATAVLKRIAPLAQRLPDTRWGAAMIAQPTPAEMDAYIESLWE